MPIFHEYLAATIHEADDVAANSTFTIMILAESDFAAAAAHVRAMRGWPRRALALPGSQMTSRADRPVKMPAAIWVTQMRRVLDGQPRCVRAASLLGDDS